MREFCSNLKKIKRNFLTVHNWCNKLHKIACKKQSKYTRWTTQVYTELLQQDKVGRELNELWVGPAYSGEATANGQGSVRDWKPATSVVPWPDPVQLPGLARGNCMELKGNLWAVDYEETVLYIKVGRNDDGGRHARWKNVKNILKLSKLKQDSANFFIGSLLRSSSLNYPTMTQFCAKVSHKIAKFPLSNVLSV